MLRRPANLFALIVAAGAPAALLLGAYISQLGFGLYPCEMCWWQRYAHFAALGFAMLAAILSGHRWWLVAAALAMGTSAAIGGYHAGVEYGWWQGITACAVPSASSAADALEAVLNAPLVRCDVAPWSMMGISLAGWNFLFSLAAALTVGFLLGRTKEG